MKNRTFILALALIGAGLTQTHAAQPKEKGFYFGGVAGISNFDDDGFGEVYDQDLNRESGAYGVFGGYKFLKYLSLEGRFTQLGDASLSLTYKPTALTANVVGILPLGSRGVELFGQAGLGAVSINENLSNVGADSQGTEQVGTIGVGIRVYPTEIVSLSLQYDRYGWEQKDKGEKYDFSTDMIMVGLQWLF